MKVENVFIPISFFFFFGLVLGGEMRTVGGGGGNKKPFLSLHSLSPSLNRFPGVPQGFPGGGKKLFWNSDVRFLESPFPSSPRPLRAPTKYYTSYNPIAPTNPPPPPPPTTPYKKNLFYPTNKKKKKKKKKK